MSRLVVLGLLVALTSAYPTFIHAATQCKKASYDFCCEVGTPCDCTKGTTAPGQCEEASYAFCCSVGTPCDCTQPPLEKSDAENQCTTDADCPCSYCMKDASKKPPYLCHADLPGVCCTKDSDCPGSYCVNYHGPPPYHCHSSESAPSDSAIRAHLRSQGYHVGDSPEALKAFLTPASVHVRQNGNEVPVSMNSTVNPADIWQIGKALWDLVNNNQPAENLTDAWAGAVPNGITDWTHLVGWEQQTSEPYTISFVNFLGMTLTEFDWVFSFKHHGAINGTGLYVTEAGVSINKAYAYLTEHLNVQVSAFKPLNYGTTASPVAGIDLQIKLTSQGKFEKTEVGCHVTIKGDGSLTEITCDKGKHHC